jgi:hypothetical protein
VALGVTGVGKNILELKARNGSSTRSSFYSCNLRYNTCDWKGKMFVIHCDYEG